MLNARNFNKSILQPIPTIKTSGKNKIEYLNVESAFDIETTSLDRNGRKYAFMYAFAFGLGHEQDIYLGRTWLEFKLILDDIIEYYELNEEKRLVIYVHNLSYEFQFMRKHFKWLDVFAIDDRKVLKAVTETGIEFRCSYLLSGYSLEYVAKNLQKYDYNKKIGDLDYKKSRHMNTPLTDKEKGYIEYDIKIVTGYINEQLDIYKDIANIPLTNTGRVRKYVRNMCYYNNNTHKKSDPKKYLRYREMMNVLTLESEEYQLLKQAFMGGFTHANIIHSGEVLENVTSYDFSSSYPAVMLSEQFPMSRGKKVQYKTIKDFENDFDRYNIVFEMRLENVSNKILQENYISENKCLFIEEPIINNGRVVKAKSLALACTEIDYQIIKACYDYDEIYIKNAVRYQKGYLPKSIIESVLNLYEDKTQLKGVNGKEVEYLLSKGMLNSIYGMTVTDIVKDNIIYSDIDTWELDKVDVDEEIDIYNNNKNRFLFYAWGVYVTAYARRNLWSGILSVGLDYVYSDTDSLKFLNHEKHTEYIETYNENLKEKMYRMCYALKINPNRLKPKDKYGNEQFIGLWDYEGTYDRFKTLGAKRYLIEEGGNIELTLAGLPKKNGERYLLKGKDPFKRFTDRMSLSKKESGKNAHTYIDDVQSLVFKDYLGNTCNMIELSGVHLGEIEFTLEISERYKLLIDQFKNGITYKGEIIT